MLWHHTGSFCLHCILGCSSGCLESLGKWNRNYLPNWTPHLGMILVNWPDFSMLFSLEALCCCTFWSSRPNIIMLPCVVCCVYFTWRALAGNRAHAHCTETGRHRRVNRGLQLIFPSGTSVCTFQKTWLTFWMCLSLYCLFLTLTCLVHGYCWMLTQPPTEKYSNSLFCPL